MDREPTESQAYAQHLLREHRRLHQMLERVEQSWPAGQSAGDGVLIARLLTAVEEFRGELAKHFAEEESGGVLEEAAARVPDLGSEQTRLEREHAPLLRELDEIIAEIRGAGNRGSLAQGVKEAFDRFIRKVVSHEVGENRVLARGFQVEVN